MPWGPLKKGFLSRHNGQKGSRRHLAQEPEQTPSQHQRSHPGLLKTLRVHTREGLLKPAWAGGALHH